MKSKILIVFFIAILLTSCSQKKQSNPNDVLLKIKNYSCSMQINFFSNKNTNSYLAKQTYNAEGKYHLEFLNKENLTIDYSNNTLSISSSPLKMNLAINNYENINQNPLFLSYFINTYFNTEKQNLQEVSEDSISLKLPKNSPYFHHAKLLIVNNKPKELTYYDINGTAKVNIIYNEFESCSS